MKRLLFWLLLLPSVVLTAAAQTARDELDADLHRSASNYMAYPVPERVRYTRAPAGYKPFYISTYARHGSRYFTHAEQYEAPAATLRAARAVGVLSPLGEEVSAALDSLAVLARGRYGELTAKGAEQHRGIARRMYGHFSDALRGDAFVEARSTTKQRCILSMANELWALRGLNPSLRLRMDASEADMTWLHDKHHPAMRLRESAAARLSVDTFALDRVRPDRLMRSLFTDTAYVRAHVDAQALMEQLFHVASGIQNHEFDYDLYKIFTRRECYNLWLRNNYEWYVDYGPSPLSAGRQPYTQENLLRNFILVADTVIASGRRGATLRFGHDTSLVPLAALMELGDCGRSVALPDSVALFWRDYRITPMGANIQLVFYRSRKHDEVLVKALLNEREVTLPVSSDVAPYYPWPALRQYYLDKLQDAAQ